MPDLGLDALTFNADSLPRVQSVEDIETYFDGCDDPQEAALAVVSRLAVLSNTARRTAFAFFLYYQLWEPMGFDRAIDAATSDDLFGLTERTFYRWKSELGLIDQARSKATSDGMLKSQRVRESKARALAESIGVTGDQLDLFEPTGKYVSQFGSRLRRLGANHLGIEARRRLYELGKEELRLGLGINTTEGISCL